MQENLKTFLIIFSSFLLGFLGFASATLLMEKVVWEATLVAQFTLVMLWWVYTAITLTYIVNLPN